MKYFLLLYLLIPISIFSSEESAHLSGYEADNESGFEPKSKLWRQITDNGRLEGDLNVLLSSIANMPVPFPQPQQPNSDDGYETKS